MTNSNEFFKKVFPFWEEINEEERNVLLENSQLEKYRANQNIYDSSECKGILIIKSGLVRVYLLSPSGKEITLYKLKPYDISILSASCILANIDFDVLIEAEEDSEIYVINPHKYKEIKNNNILVERFTNSVINQSFSDVMWIMNQILFMSFDKRLAIFLLDESIATKSDTLKITHDYIAKNMGTAREVVSRMLKYFQTENMITLSRGTITLTDKKKLKTLL